MIRKIAQFLLWLALFGLFLTFAAYQSGNSRADMLIGSSLLLLIAWRTLRKRPERFEPSKRFRTLRRLGLIEGAEEIPEKD
jgi:hypothetical protein